MTKLSNLPNWNKLSKEEKSRLKEVFAPREKANYDISGKLSVSKKELKKAKNG